jgi:hypothetical protein
MSRAEPIDKPSLILIIALLSVSGVTSFIGAEEMVKAKAAGKPLTRSVQICRIIAPKVYIFGAAILFTQFLWI